MRTDRPTAAVPGDGNGPGIAGFVSGLLGVLLSWFPPVAIVLGLLGVVLGGIGMSQGRRRGRRNGLALAGVVLGVITLIVSAVLLAVIASSL